MRWDELMALRPGRDRFTYKGKCYYIARVSGWSIYEDKVRAPVFPCDGGKERHITIAIKG
jgi:hypothetical protein